MGFLETGSTWLQEKRDTDFSVLVDYYTKDGKTVYSQINASISESRFRTLTEDGLSSREHKRDYKIKASDINNHKPSIGDRIIEGDQIQEVLPIIDRVIKRPCWTWTDINKTVYRIHTKNIN